MAELRPARLLPPGLGLHRRMAGPRSGPFAPARPAGNPATRWGSASRDTGRTLARWADLALASLLLLGTAHAQVTASRIWPAKDYTRLTLESQSSVAHQVFSVNNPDRLVLDLETEMTPALAELDGKVVADDPYIKGLRVARNRPGVTRVVLDLKVEVRPQVFSLPPVGEYGHRLVLDIYPVVAADPLVELIEQSNKPSPPPAAAPGAPPAGPAGPEAVARPARPRSRRSDRASGR